MQTRKYYIKTYGCQMNVHDSERMAGLLQHMGYQPSTDEDRADIILLNTCSVREKADHKLFTKLGRLSALKSRSNDLVIAVAGCIAQRAAEEILRRAPFVDIVLGPRAVPRLPQLIESFMDTGEKQICTELPKDFDRHNAYVRNSSVVGYVTIMEGCNKFCSYCIVPFTRGREVSKPFEYVMEEVHDLADKGFREIQLLGQNVNSYNDRIAGKNFADMLKEVSDVAGISRIRFITSHPNHLTEEMMQVMAERDNICNALHLPPQAGSTKILKAMRRRYTREEYLETVEMLKHYMRNISLSGDIIVGFPGETEEDFQQTLELLHEVRFSSLFSFVYSPRPGTKAEVYGDTVPYQAKVDRLHRLQEVQSAIQLEEHENMIGTIQTVLFDSTSQKREEQIVGRTEGYLVVNAALSVDYIGKLVPMTITDAGPHSLTGQIVPALTNAV